MGSLFRFQFNHRRNCGHYLRLLDDSIVWLSFWFYNSKHTQIIFPTKLLNFCVAFYRRLFWVKNIEFCKCYMLCSNNIKSKQYFSKASESSIHPAPNTACSRLVGFVPTYKHFSGFGFFLLSERISSRPPAANANR